MSIAEQFRGRPKAASLGVPPVGTHYYNGTSGSVFRVREIVPHPNPFVNESWLDFEIVESRYGSRVGTRHRWTLSGAQRLERQFGKRIEPGLQVVKNESEEDGPTRDQLVAGLERNREKAAKAQQRVAASERRLREFDERAEQERLRGHATRLPSSVPKEFVPGSDLLITGLGRDDRAQHVRVEAGTLAGPRFTIPGDTPRTWGQLRNYLIHKGFAKVHVIVPTTGEVVQVLPRPEALLENIRPWNTTPGINEF